MILQISVMVVTSTKTINPCINTCLIAGVFLFSRMPVAQFDMDLIVAGPA